MWGHMALLPFDVVDWGVQVEHWIRNSVTPSRRLCAVFMLCGAEQGRHEHGVPLEVLSAACP